MKNLKLISVTGAALLAAGLAAAENGAYTQLADRAKNPPPAVPAPSLSASKAIYGENSMQEYYQASEPLKRLADSTVAFVRKSDLYFDPAENIYRIKNSVRLSEAAYADESEDFSAQSRLSSCSGAYLGGGLVMTAGHCLSDEPKDYSYFGDLFMVFGWKYDEAGSPAQDFPADAVYAIKKIEIRALEGPTGDMRSYRDFALVSMDREPSGRRPLALETEQAPRIGQRVFTIGYPLGLAVKINAPDQARIFTLEKNGFQTNIDAFGGNSGGPVFDSATNKITGILVTGAGGEFSYELNRDFSFIADFSLPTDVIEYKPQLGTVALGSALRGPVLETLRNSSAAISILDEHKCLITLPGGSRIQNRSPLFSLVTQVGGKNVFNRGRLLREKQDSFGTGVLLVPAEIKNLVRPR